jgi:tRNA-dihydrouridine synthase B
MVALGTPGANARIIDVSAPAWLDPSSRAVAAETGCAVRFEPNGECERGPEWIAPIAPSVPLGLVLGRGDMCNALTTRDNRHIRMRIGPVQIAHPFVLAPLSGYSDLPMRRVARRYGAAYAVNAVVLDRCVSHDGPWQRRLLTVEPDDHPVGAQIMGADPAACAAAARCLAAAGYDVIDLNFACPVPKVVGRRRGGYLLGQPQVALEIIRRVLGALGAERPVTLKLRRGADDSAQSEQSFFAILDGAFALGVAAVTVHARTVAQGYAGLSDQGFLARVKRHVGNRIVFGSGDLFTARACLDMLWNTGVDGVTLARGARGNPWIFRDCLALAAGQPLPAPPSLAEQRDTIAFHLAEAIQFYGPRLASKVMRQFGIEYSSLHPRPRQVRAAFVAVRTPGDFQAALARWYAGDRVAPDFNPAFPTQNNTTKAPRP